MGKMENGEPQTLETPQTPDTPQTPRTHPLAGVKSFDDIALCMGLEGRKVTTDQRKWGGKRGKLLWQIVGN